MSRRDEDLILLGDLAETYTNLTHAVTDTATAEPGLSAGERAVQEATHHALVTERDRAFHQLTLHAENLSVGKLKSAA